MTQDTLPTFGADDFAIFRIGEFEAQIGAMWEQVTPKLERWGDAVAGPLGRKVGCELFPHVARHLRRKTTPPPETWVAWGPRTRSYKSDPIFALTVSADGVQARLMLKHEALDLRQRLPEVAPAMADELAAAVGKTPLRDFYGRDFDAKLPAPFDPADAAAWEAVCAAATKKSRAFDVGFAFTPAQSARLTPRKVVNALAKLLPLHAALLAEAGLTV